MSRLERSLPLLLLAAGCRPDKPVEDPPVVQLDGGAVDLEVGVAEGPAPLGVPVFATNIAGAPVPGGTVALSSGATLAEDSLDLSLDPWGEATVTGGASGAWSLSASGDGDEADGEAWLFPAAPPELGAWGVATGGHPTAVAVAGEGLVWAEGGELWWTAVPDGARARVLDMPDPIDAVVPVQLDGDGVGDLLVWSASQVVLLRGRSAGGLSWRDGWAAARGQIVGADLADLDGDATPDLAIATTDGETSTVAWMPGQADGSWLLTDRLVLAWPIQGLSAEDLDGDDDAEITVLSMDGLLRRYGHFDGAWAGTTGAEIDVYLGGGSRLLPSDDFDADGLEDLVAVGPMADGTGWQAWIVSVPERVLYRLYAGSAELPLPSTAWASSLDLDGDGARELVIGSDTEVRRATWNADRGTFDFLADNHVLGGGPVAVGDLDGDGVAELVSAPGPVAVYPGTSGADWGLAAPDYTLTDFDLHLDPLLGDLDGDTIVDMVAISRGGTSVEVGFYVGTPPAGADAERFRRDALIAVEGDEPVAAVRCGAEVWMLYDEDGVRKLWGGGYSDAEGFEGPAVGVAVDGELLACGDYAEGVKLLVVSGDGEVTRVRGLGDLSSGGAGERYVAVTAADPDGDGVDELVGCATEGCSVAALDLDGDGADEVVTAADGEVSADGSDPADVRTGGGALSVGDADGDGAPDLLSNWDGVVSVWRAGGVGLAPGWARVVRAPVSGPASFGDLDGDGVADLFLRAVDDDPADEESWDGTLLYLHGAR